MKNTAFDTAVKVVKTIDDKLGTDIIVLDLNNVSTLCDYFVIASASSVRQAKSIADDVKNKLQEEDLYPSHKEGYDSGGWILIDYGDIVVHIFTKEEREFYDIEGIWKDATIINIDKIIEDGV